MFLPPFILALGWFHLFGAGGAAGSAATSAVLFSSPGAVVVLALAFAPVVTVLTVLGLDGVDHSLEDAARTVAGPWRVATRILLPIAWPSAALGALVVFALAFSELGVPMFLRVRAYPAGYAVLSAFDPPGDSAATIAISDNHVRTASSGVNLCVPGIDRRREQALPLRRQLLEDGDRGLTPSESRY